MTDRPQYPSYPGDDDQTRPRPTEQWPPPYGQQPTYGQAPIHGQVPPPGYGYGAPPPRTSGQAVASLVLGIVSILFCYLGVLIGPVAVIFAVLGRREVDRQPGVVAGRGMATAGLVTGIIGTVIWAAVIALVVVAVVTEP